MHLMYTLDANGKRIYTLKKVNAGEVTKSAHPARFSPDDKYSRYVVRVCSMFVFLNGRQELMQDSFDRHRVTLKRRYGLLMTQQSERTMSMEARD